MAGGVGGHSNGSSALVTYAGKVAADSVAGMWKAGVLIGVAP